MQLLLVCSDLQTALLLLLCRPGWGPSTRATAACPPKTCRCCCSARASMVRCLLSWGPAASPSLQLAAVHSSPGCRLHGQEWTSTAVR